MLSLRKKTRFVQHWHILAHLNACYHCGHFELKMLKVISIPDNFQSLGVMENF